MDLKNYELVQFPFEGKFSDLSKEDSQRVFEWFLKAIPERLDFLFAVIKNEDKNLYKQLDYSQKSLIYIGEWLSRHVHKRNRTREEIRKEYENLNPKFKGHLEIEDWVLSDETISLCFDVGIYFSKVFQRKFKDVKWSYYTKPKNDIDVNKPILRGFKIPLNPFNIVLVFASKVVDKNQGSQYLYNLFEIWRKDLK